MHQKCGVKKEVGRVEKKDCVGETDWLLVVEGVEVWTINKSTSRQPSAIHVPFSAGCGGRLCVDDLLPGVPVLGDCVPVGDVVV